jgi:hypothetical protein
MDSKTEKYNYYSQQLVRLLILIYWSLYWLFNSLDKLIGGSQFLWVGKDRFAQFYRYFDSAGWTNPLSVNITLMIVAALEIFAFLFSFGALIQLLLKNTKTASSWFNISLSTTLAIFTIFSFGDQLFGDRFELLEHTLFWLVALFTWVVFAHAEKLTALSKTSFSSTQIKFSLTLMILMSAAASYAIFKHKYEAFYQRAAGVHAQPEGENLYKCTFPFLAGGKSFEKTLDIFMKDYPNKKIVQIYTVPDELRKQKADALIIYITTSDIK